MNAHTSDDSPTHLAANDAEASDAITTRDYRREDAAALAAVFRNSIAGIDDALYSPAQRAAWASFADDAAAFAAFLDEGWVRLAVDDTSIIGFAQLNVPGQLVMLYVLPAAQRRGVAHQLMDDMVALAGAMAAREITTEASLAAQPFFTAMGFRTLAQETVQRGGEQLVRVRMSVSL